MLFDLPLYVITFSDDYVPCLVGVWTMIETHENIASQVATECFDKFRTLPKQGKPTDKQWTVLAGIVLVRNHSEKLELKIVSLATGTKCLDGSTRLESNPGTLLHDSHAEVLARRGFILWLVEEMLLAKINSTKFVSKTGEDKYELGDGWKIFMLTTHPPCGDGSIFEKSSEIIEQIHDKVASDESVILEPPVKKVKLDVNRTGAKCVTGSDPLTPGVEYHKVGLVRTKPGRGERTLSLSCSDKMLKWNISGLQGALCSYFLTRKLHLYCFLVSGKLFNLSSLTRALYTRAGVDDINKPHIVEVNNVFEFSKSDSRVSPCPDSVVWVGIGEGKFEALTEGHKQGWSKKKLSNPKSWSMLCQINLSKKILDLGRDTIVQSFKTYSDLKLNSPSHLNIKISESSILLNWPKKEFSKFSLPT